MRYLGLSAALAALLAGCAPAPSQAREPDNIVPVRIDDAQIQNSLAGWTKSPVPHAKNRIILTQRGYKDARALTVENDTLDFERAVREALSKEDISSVRIIEQRDVQGQIAQDFRTVTGIQDGQFRSWIAQGKGPLGAYTIAGFSLISPRGDDPGISVEMFLAPTDEFESLGGFAVPVVRYLDNTITQPPRSMRDWGSMSAADAVTEMDVYFARFMAQIIRGRILQGMMTQQTLGMLKGLGPNGEYGINDPMYDF
ncbi:MAG: hypothetical protein AAF494_07610 [Pseudomonadota bacterium]